MSSLHFPALFVASPHSSFRNRSVSIASPLSVTPVSGSCLGFSTVASRHNSLHLRTEGNRNLSRISAAGSESESDSESSDVKREPMLPPYNVLITGSTKGIGYALAKEFLKAGDDVVICSRSAERVESAVQILREEFGEQHVVLSVMLEMGMMSRLSLYLPVRSSNT